MLVLAAFVIVAVQYSDFGNGDAATITVPGAAPPPSASPIAVRLANAVGRANLGSSHRAVDMAAVAPFAWDRMYVFANETSVDIRRALGFDWKGAPGTVPRSGRHESLLVFARGRSVAGSAFFSDAIGRLDCLAADGAYPRGTSFRIHYAAEREPFVTSARPGGLERKCLVGAGAVTGD